MRFWDSSAVAALCVEEPGAELVTFDERLAEADRLEGLAVRFPG